jgi:hypothetical protein
VRGDQSARNGVGRVPVQFFHAHASKIARFVLNFASRMNYIPRITFVNIKARHGRISAWERLLPFDYAARILSGAERSAVEGARRSAQGAELPPK